MSKINTLLSKAMSTSSEDEAIACLRMARKHGLAAEGVTVDKQAASADMNALIKDASQRITILTRMYHAEAIAKLVALQRIDRISTELRIEKSKPKVTVGLLLVVLLLGAMSGIFLAVL